MAEVFIGTSGWHYDDWTKLFYPPEITGYHELTFHAGHFTTVENNSSFYRIAQEGTYKTWDRMTPDSYRFSIKLNKFITHEHKLELTNDVKDTIGNILSSTQVLGDKLGAILIQLPPSFKVDLQVLDNFLAFLRDVIDSQQYHFDVAIEFRNKYWFNDETYGVLRKYNVALVAGQSSRYPMAREVTADIAYIRMHGPEKLFDSSYTTEQLEEWADYINKISPSVKRVYVYFNNDFHGYALDNAKELQRILRSHD